MTADISFQDEHDFIPNRRGALLGTIVSIVVVVAVIALVVLL